MDIAFCLFINLNATILLLNHRPSSESHKAGSLYSLNKMSKRVKGTS